MIEVSVRPSTVTRHLMMLYVQYTFGRHQPVKYLVPERRYREFYVELQDQLRSAGRAPVPFADKDGELLFMGRPVIASSLIDEPAAIVVVRP